MNQLTSMLWIEARKAIRSRLPLWTALGSLFMPCGIAFLIFVARNPEISQKLGLVGAKANLLSYSTTDWEGYLKLSGMMIAAGGFFFYTMAISWVFGREFSDGTVKDLLAVPVRRSSIILAKFIVSAAWGGVLTLMILGAGLLTGAVMQLPGGSDEVILQGILRQALTAVMVIGVVLPFGLLAGVGRGYLLPLAAAVLMLMMTNLVALLGWGESFPWAIPGLYAQGESLLPIGSFVIVALTGLAGIAVTLWWWKQADQNR